MPASATSRNASRSIPPTTPRSSPSARRERIDLVVVGPEAPLVAGLVDDLGAAGIRAFGPTKAAAQLEGSKGFTKDLCREAGIPTAGYRRFTDRGDARAYVEGHALPVVVKADGLAAGKGVTVATERDDGARRARRDLLRARRVGRHRGISRRRGGELLRALRRRRPSSPSAPRRTTSAPSTATKARTPAAWAPIRRRRSSSDAMSERVMAEIIRPTVAALAERGIRYRGVLFAGLMIDADGPEAHRIQRPLRRPGMPGADDAAEGRPPDDPRRRRRRRARPGQRALARGGGALRRHGDEGLSRRLRKGLRNRAGSRPRRASRTSRSSMPARGAADGRILAEAGACSASPRSGRRVAEAQARAYQAVDLIDWPEVSAAATSAGAHWDNVLV